MVDKGNTSVISNPVKNRLVDRLLDALFSSDNQFSLTDDTSVLDRRQCCDKIKQYIDWINQLDVHSVMIISTPGIESLCLCYALIICNKTYIPVHTSTSPELLQSYLDDYHIDLLLVQPNLVRSFDGELKKHLIKGDNEFFYYYQPQKKGQKFCLAPGMVFFTSGTTAQPKAVHYYYNTPLRFILWCVEEFRFSNKDYILFTTELSFVASLRPLFVPVIAGANVVFSGNDSANKLQLIVNTLKNNKITVLSITPTLFNILLCQIKKSSFIAALQSVRLVLLSGEPINTNDINYWFEHIKQDTVFYNLYGTTEYLVPFYKKINEPLKEEERLHLGQLRSGCNYKLMKNRYNCYELYIAGDISTSYLDKTLNQNNYIIAENRRFLTTGDIVERYHQDLFYISPSQRIVKQYGQIANLTQIENILKKRFHHLNFIAFSGEENQNTIYLLISGTEESEALLRQVKQTLKQHLPGYMHPGEYFFSKEHPLTSTGKTDYYSIKKIFVRKPITSLYDYFKRFFPDGQVNREARIANLGLESIHYIEMAKEYWQLTGKWLDVSKITDDMTIANITSCLVDRKLKKTDFHDIVQLNTTQAECHKVEIQQPHLHGNYITVSFGLKGRIDINRLERAIAATIANHFMLHCKLMQMDDDYFFVPAPIQTNFRLRTFFARFKNVLGKLKTSIHADRLFNVYIHKNKGRFFLIMAYHHIAIDGWSAMMIREEIFRRYEGFYVSSPYHRVSVTHPDDCYPLSHGNEINFGFSKNSLDMVFSKITGNQHQPQHHQIHFRKAASGSLQDRNLQQPYPPKP